MLPKFPVNNRRNKSPESETKADLLVTEIVIAGESAHLNCFPNWEPTG